MNHRTDKQTTVGELRQLMAQFVAERDWDKFHSPKNLAMALTIEAGELMEHFQWLTTEQSKEIDDSVKHDVGDREKEHHDRDRSRASNRCRLLEQSKT